MKSPPCIIDDPKHWQNRIWLTSHDIPAHILKLGYDLIGKEKKLFDILQIDDFNEAICDAFANNLSASYAIENEHLDSSVIKSTLIRQMNLEIPGWKKDAGESRESRAVGMTLSLLNTDKLDHNAICNAHGMLEYKYNWGRYREGDEEEVIKDANGNMVYFAPEPYLVRGQMDDFLEWFNDDRLNLPNQIGLAIAHYIFVSIHPFVDGNGRIARALSEKALITGPDCRFRPYSISTQIFNKRNDYNKALASSNPLDFPMFMINMHALAIEEGFHTAQRLQFVKYFLKRGDFSESETAIIKIMAMDERLVWSQNDFTEVKNAENAWDSLLSKGVIDENGIFNKEWRNTPRFKTTFFTML